MKQKTSQSHKEQIAWSKLTPQEKIDIQAMLNRKINASVDKMKEVLKEETEKNIKDALTKSWDDIEDSLVEAMKNNHISEERIQRIINTCNDIGDRKHGIKLQDRDINQYIVLTKDQFSYLIEAAAFKCENCFNKPEECELYKLMKAKCVPEMDGYKMQVCKYAYGKEVV